jgi:hypothetical protein
VEPVLTVRQPRASAAFVAGKDVENRKTRTHYRGRLWIHAGLHPSRREPDRWAERNGIWLPEEPLPRGVIVGCVELVDCVEDSDSPWALPDRYMQAARLLRQRNVSERPTQLCRRRCSSARSRASAVR